MKRIPRNLPVLVVLLLSACGSYDEAAMGTLTFSDIDIMVLSKDTALVFGRWQLDKETGHPHGLYTLLFRKTPEGWRIVHDHSSSAPEG
jgi:ketosteroid isomerase-like protein